jgi:hypothetical protein
LRPRRGPGLRRRGVRRSAADQAEQVGDRQRAVVHQRFAARDADRAKNAKKKQ